MEREFEDSTCLFLPEFDHSEIGREDGRVYASCKACEVDKLQTSAYMTCDRRISDHCAIRQFCQSMRKDKIRVGVISVIVWSIHGWC